MSADQAQGLRAAREARDAGDAARREGAGPGAARGSAPQAGAPRWVAVASGKGGVGKTNLVANLAVAAAGLGKRTLVVDGDLGLANVDVLLGLAPPLGVAELLEGACTLEQALVQGPRGMQLLPAASARAELAAAGGERLAQLVELLRRGAAGYDLVLIDAGAGIGPAVVGLARACARALVVTTPEPTSLADAYATLKVLRQAAPALALDVVVNAARDELEARRTQARLGQLARRFLAFEVGERGWLPRDPCLPQAVARQRAVVEAYPTSRWARGLVALAEQLLRDTGAWSDAAAAEV